MKPKAQKIITLETITDYLSNNSLLEARSILAESKDSTIKITGLVEKIAKRDDLLRFVIKTSGNGREMTVFANFDDDESKAKVKELKIKKGLNVSVIGTFQSFGTDAVVINSSYLS